MTTINTVLGPCKPEDLGLTLMHEHLIVGFPGWYADTAAPPFRRGEVLKRCIDQMEELKALGVHTLLDPCPADGGRDAEFMAEVAQTTGVHIICAAGLYKEDLGGAAYFKFRTPFADMASEMAETFTKEITDGIGGSGIKAGILKVATQANRVSPYEEMVLRAAARTAKATGIRITTHTDSGTMGREQLDIFAAEGVNLKHVIVGHSCGCADLRYHVDMLDRGCMLGFDQFGVDLLHPDRLRTASLIGLLGIGFEKQIFLSHDSVWYWRGRPLSGPAEIMQKLQNWNPMHLFKNIIPALREAGVPQGKIDTMLIENPRRFFSE